MHVGLLLCRAEQRHPHADRDQHGEQGRQQSAGPAQPELREPHAPGGLLLLQQQRRDEVSGDDEEDLDTEETPVHPPETGVVEDDSDDGDGPQPVEPGLIAHRRRIQAGRPGIREPTSFEVGKPIEGAVFEHVSH